MAPDRKRRIPIPEAVAAEVGFAADRTCCVCHVSGKHFQIHHIDDDPSNNAVENLTVLCLECHAQTQLSGGFGRTLNAALVRRYRDHWLQVVEMRRAAQLLTSELQQQLPVDAADASEGPSSASEGQTFRNLGIVLSFIDVSESDSVALNKSGYQTGSRYAKHTNTAAGPGAKFVTVQTRVLNDAQESIDLTCSYPIAAFIFDDRERRFDPIDSLYEVPGNPECNAHLQPGFESDMTWIFRVPKTARIVAFEFEDVIDMDAADDNEPTRFRLVL